jgi:hypothetical protein
MFLVIFAQKIFKVVYARAGLDEVSRCDKCTVYMTANYDGDLMILSRLKPPFNVLDRKQS